MVALVSILAGVAVPTVNASLNRSTAWAAARYLNGRIAMARTYAVTRSANVALRFSWTGADATFQMFVDRNGDGVRNADISSGIDTPLDTAVSLSSLFPGVAMKTEDGSTPVHVGSSNLLSFTPLGTATPGSLYVRGRDGLQLALRVVGATGRARVLRYDSSSGSWVESF